MSLLIRLSIKEVQNNFMRILVAVQGNYGQRIFDNIRKYGPADWKVDSNASWWTYDQAGSGESCEGSKGRYIRRFVLCQ